MKLMEEHVATIYGDHLADVYDHWFGSYESATINTLAGFAQGRPVLELGIGTGRIALPLAAKGIDVHGIDASRAMISKLKAKKGGDSIRVTMGNFADVSVKEKFSLIFAVFNTFFSLLTQEEQVRCFNNVATRLTDDGVFIIEAFVPEVGRFKRGQSIRTYSMTSEYVCLQVSQHDSVRQRIKSQHILFINDELKLYPDEVRYAWPSELDLMAQIAGLRLRNRWSGWEQEEFKSGSERHVSVYERIR